MTEPIAEGAGSTPMSSNLLTTLGRANDYARAQSHKKVTLEHILLALSEDPDALVLLRTTNVDIDALKADVSGHISRNEDRHHDSARTDLTISSEVGEIMKAASAAARGRRPEINGAIVLAAIVGDGRSTAAHTLKAQGLTFEHAIQFLRAAPTAAPEAGPAPVAAQDDASQSAQDILAQARSRVQTRVGPGEVVQEPVAQETPEPPPASVPQPAAIESSPPPVPMSEPPGAAPAHREPQPQPAPPPPASQQPPARPSQPVGPQQRPQAPVPAPSQVSAEPDEKVLPSLDDVFARSKSSAPIHPVPSGTFRGPRPGSPPGGQPPPSSRIPPSQPGPPPPQQPPRYPSPPPQAGAPQAPAPPAGSLPPQARRQPPPPNFDPRRAQGGSPVVPQGGASGVQTIEAGQLVENIPRSMTVGIPMLVEARIAKGGVRVVAQGMQGAGQPQRHEILVTKAMSVRLRAPANGFVVENASPETQWIDNNLGALGDDFASWRWTITPKTSGKKQLQLVVSARTVGSDGLAAETVLPDQIIGVKVRTNYSKVVKRWSGWVAAAIVGGLFARFGESFFDLTSKLLERISAG